MTINKDLIKYFEDGLRLGNPINVLEKNLIDAGWPEELVEENSNLAQNKNCNEKKDEKANYSLGLKNLGKKKRPIGIAICSIFHWLIAFVWIYLFTFVFVIFSTFIGGFNEKSAFFINLGLGIVVSSIPIIVGIGLWKGINAWRIVSIVFSSIFIIFSILVIVDGGFSAIILLVASLIILIYLSVNKKVRYYFRK